MSYSLNLDQKRAVEYTDGPMLVVAGAGTGKTSVIIEKIKYLIDKDYAKQNEILALTFTEKAANEMIERLDYSLPLGYTNMWVHTFHGFCDRVLKDDGIEIGLPQYNILSVSEATRFFQKNIFHFNLKYYLPLSNPNKFIDAILKHFSRLQDEAVGCDEYSLFVKNKFGSKKLDEDEIIDFEKFTELSNAFQIYNNLKLKNGYLDFGDLITKTIELFEKRPNILKKYKNKFPFVLVDEFQDTNYAQNKLLHLLCDQKSNLTVVGDDDQSIYKFRGGNVGNILSFTKYYKNSEVVVLNKNYRSSQKILDLSYKLIQHNNPNRLEISQKIDKKLISQIEVKNSEVEFFYEDNAEKEAMKVSQIIQDLIKNDKYNFSDFAILVRANNHADYFTKELEKNNLPHQVLGTTKLFNQKEVSQIVNFLKFISDLEDSNSLYSVLSIKYFDIQQKDLIKILSFAKKNNKISLYEALEKIDQINVADLTKNQVKNFLKIVEKTLTNLNDKRPSQIIYDFLYDSNLIKNYLDPQNELQLYQAENIKLFFDKVKNFEMENSENNIFDFVNWIDLQIEFGDSPMAQEQSLYDEDSIKILTVHSSKGLEFKVVFVVNLVALRFPSIDREEKIPIDLSLIKENYFEENINEERRLMYVALTRAKEKLYLTAAKNYGGKGIKKVSQFILELFPEDFDKFSKSIEKNSVLNFDVLDNKKSINIKNKYKVDTLSFSKIDEFEKCPLHYKLKYILNIPTKKSPSLVLGNSIHEALNNFYLNVKNNAYKKISEKNLLHEFEKSWINESFENKIHAQAMYKKGEEMLVNYFNNYFNFENLPSLLEIPFKIPLHKKNQSLLKIVGKMDRVDVFENGDIEIIDYKTGENKKDQKKADEDLQLTIYAIAANSIKEKPFGVDVKKIKLSLLYLDDLTKITTTRSKSDLEKSIEKIFDVRSQIEESDFVCSKSYYCNSCEFRDFCNI